MDNDIKKTMKNIQLILDITVKDMVLLNKEDIKQLLNCITNLQEENERFKKIAHKMHLWIFLHSGDEQKVYDELGLTDEENAMLGYSGQFRIGSDDND